MLSTLLGTDGSITKGARYHLCWHLQQGMFQELSGAVQRTPATALNNRVGYIFDPSTGCHYTTSTTTTPNRAPTLGLYTGVGDRQCYGKFGINTAAGGTAAKFLLVQNSRLSFSHFFDTRRSGTFAMWVKFTAHNGVACYIADCQGITSAAGNPGFSIYRDTDNKIYAYILNSNSGQWIIPTAGCGTSATFTSGSWHSYILTMNGSVYNLYVDGEQDGTANRALSANAGATPGTPCVATNLVFGARYNLASNTGFAEDTIQIGDVLIDDTAWGPTEIAAFQAYDPVASNADLSAFWTGQTVGVPTSYAGLAIEHDFGDATKTHTTNTKTNGVYTGANCTNGDPVGCCEHSLGVDYQRDALAAANDTTRPTYKTSNSDVRWTPTGFLPGGVGSLFFDGADVTPNDKLIFTGWDTIKGGDWTCFLVVKNLKAAGSSHPMGTSGGTSIYIPVVGDNYLGGDTPTPYVTMHANGVDGYAQTTFPTEGSTGPPIVISFRADAVDGTLECLVNGTYANMTNSPAGDRHIDDFVNGLLINEYSEGADSTVTAMDGYICHMAKYNCYLSDQHLQEIGTYLADRYGAANFYAPLLAVPTTRWNSWNKRTIFAGAR